MDEIEDLILQGNKMIRESKFEQALELFEQALSVHPDNPDLWNGKGVALRSIGRYEEAVECFDRSLQIEPRDRDSS